MPVSGRGSLAPFTEETITNFPVTIQNATTLFLKLSLETYCVTAESDGQQEREHLEIH